jgi:hypothetical protein
MLLSKVAQLLFSFSLTMNMEINSTHAFYFHIPKLSIFCVVNPDNYIRNLKHYIKCCNHIFAHCTSIFTIRRYVGFDVIRWRRHSEFQHHFIIAAGRTAGVLFPKKQDFSLLYSIHTGSGEHPASCAMNEYRGLFPRGYSNLAVKLITHPSLHFPIRLSGILLN